MSQTKNLPEILQKVPFATLMTEINRRTSPSKGMHLINDTVADTFRLDPYELRFARPHTRSVAPARYAAMILMRRLMDARWDEIATYYDVTKGTAAKSLVYFETHRNRSEEYRARAEWAEAQLLQLNNRNCLRQIAQEQA